MLVLALQFSRGDVTHAELCPSDRGARRSGVGESVEVPLPQNGREDGDCRRFELEGGTESLSTSRSDG